jgi:hypothetical protein
MHPRIALMLLVASLALAACAAQPSAPAPVAVDPTMALAPSAPRPTKPPAATATPDKAAPLRAAIDRTKALASYHVTFRMGGTGQSPAGAAQLGDLIHFTGAFNRGDVAFQYGGSGAQTGSQGDLEVVTAGGQTYALGPLPLQGVTKAVWYALGTEPPTATQPPLDIARILTMATERVQLSDFAPDGEERLHDLACARYRGGLAAALGALDGMGRPTTPEARAAEATPVAERMKAQGITFSAAEALVWICPDGYLHQMRVSMTGERKEQPGQPFTLTLEISVADPNGAITITTPVGAAAPGAALTATVSNGGNVREQPNLQGTVRDQINARETVLLIGKSADGRWYHILNVRRVDGWVSKTLLRIDRAVDAKVPTA